MTQKIVLDRKKEGNFVQFSSVVCLCISGGSVHDNVRSRHSVLGSARSHRDVLCSGRNVRHSVYMLMPAGPKQEGQKQAVRQMLQWP